MMILLIAVAVLTVPAIAGAIAGLIGYASTEAKAERQIKQILKGDEPPTRIERRPGDAPSEPGNPAIEAWYQAYEARYPGADPYPIPQPSPATA